MEPSLQLHFIVVLTSHLGVKPLVNKSEAFSVTKPFMTLCTVLISVLYDLPYREPLGCWNFQLISRWIAQLFIVIYAIFRAHLSTYSLSLRYWFRLQSVGCRQDRVRRWKFALLCCPKDAAISRWTTKKINQTFFLIPLTWLNWRLQGNLREFL